MPSKLQGLFSTWGALAPQQRIMVAFLAAATVVSLIIVTMVASRPDYTVLFSNLKPEDASAIAQKLTDQKVQYRITGNGTAIEVPAPAVYDVRLSMAGQGLPQGGSIGFEVFDKGSLGVTDFSQKMNYLRALQGELQRTISSLDNVADARVHIVLPEEKLYSDKQNDASASVVINLKSPNALDETSVQSITNLVSAAVEGLKPEAVTVVDTQGRMLSSGDTQDAMGLRMSATQLEIKRSVERGMQRDVEGMLDRVIGPGKAVVRVSARMSFDARQTTSELFQPGENAGQGVITSQQTTTETYGPGSTAMAGGVPGTASNLQPAQATTATARSGGYSRNQSETQYQVSKRIEKTESAPGTLQQVKVAVLVDREVAADKVPSLQRAVSAAAGIDAARGDEVVVQAVEFPKEPAAAKPSLIGSIPSVPTLGRNAVALVLIAVFMFVIRGSLGKQAALVQAPAMAPAASGAAPAASAPATPSTTFKRDADGDSSLSEAQNLARQSPDEVANVVRTWLAEDKKAA